MIGALISLLLQPLLPSLEDPRGLHAAEMVKVFGVLEKTSQPVAVDPALLAFTPPTPAPLPVITGRLLGQSVATANGVSKGEPKPVWTLTGVIQSAGQRVAILNDGARDHVVAQGSLVNRQFRVDSLTATSAMLVPVSGEQRKPIQLILSDISKTGASR